MNELKLNNEEEQVTFSLAIIVILVIVVRWKGLFFMDVFHLFNQAGVLQFIATDGDKYLSSRWLLTLGITFFWDCKLGLTFEI